MAYIMLPEDKLELKVFCYASPQVGINSYKYRVLDNDDDMTDDELAQIMSPIIAPLYQVIMPPGARYSGISLQDQFPLIQMTQTSTEGAGPGTIGVNMCGTQLTGLISKYTQHPGRTGRGRVYIPFVPADYCNAAGHPSLDYTIGLQDIAEQLLQIQTYTGGGKEVTLVPVLFNISDGIAWDITSHRFRVKFANQHRRGDYGKMNPEGPYGGS